MYFPKQQLFFATHNSNCANFPSHSLLVPFNSTYISTDHATTKLQFDEIWLVAEPARSFDLSIIFSFYSFLLYAHEHEKEGSESEWGDIF